MSRMTDMCDIECDTCFQWEAGTVASEEEARAILKRGGWTTKVPGVYHPVDDVCPACNGNNPSYWKGQFQ